MSTHQTPPKHIGLGKVANANRLSLEVTEHDVARHCEVFAEVEAGRTPHRLLDDMLATTRTSFGILEKANLGWLLSRSLRSTEAVSRLATDLQVMPKSRNLPLYYAISLMRTGNFADAGTILESLAVDSPDNKTVRNYLGHALIQSGRWTRGLQEMEPSRESLPTIQKPYYADRTRLWKGENLDEKCIVAVSNGRHSDQIQFSRYISGFREMGVDKIGIVCSPALADLMRGISGADRIETNYFEPFDYFVPIESLPLRFQEKSLPIPNPPYLHYSARSVMRKKGELNANRPLLGIAWRNPETEGITDEDRNYRIRANSLDIDSLKNCITRIAPRYDVVSFQSDLQPAERDILQQNGCRILDNSAFENYAGIAEWMASMDKFVTVDGPLAHLAGALGLQAHVLLPWIADWKWSIRDGVSLWYPDLVIHQKTTEADWQPCLEKVVTHLETTTASSGVYQVQS